MSKRFKRSTILAAIGVSILASVALAEDVWIKSESVDIRSGKGAVYPVVVTVKKGTKLSVIDHEGSWLKVQAGDQQGYVFQNAISPQAVSGGGNLLAGLGGNDTSQLSSGAAAKGLSESADQYAQQKNLNPAAMNHLIDFRKQIDPKDWEQFTADGNVGPHAPGAQ